MRSYDVIQAIAKGQEQGMAFVKWWCKENDFVDYELVDEFIRNADPEHELAGFELLDLEQMWRALKRWNPQGVRKSKMRQPEMIHWAKKDQRPQRDKAFIHLPLYGQSGHVNF